ncbi:YidB family protein [Bradyrhizobium mercantei]|uniref:YidB family protein n=1 Tax=Bradyrhizobium mercantei TaxID=1904807 RepID=UPI000975A472|nr:YidB family protein [Bradyrhizobium mercantei]
MGLLDVLNGMQNGPRGPSAPSTSSDSSSGGGMSPMTMAILALLAWKAVKHFSGGQPGATASEPEPKPAQAPQLPGNVTASLPGGGGLGDLLKGGLGGLLAGGAAGTVLSGGLGDLLNQLQQKGHGDAANSWVSNGPNKQIAPGDLANALGADQIDSLASQSGMSRDQLLQGLSQYLPDAINHLTPDGRLPSGDELHRRL